MNARKDQRKPVTKPEGEREDDKEKGWRALPVVLAQKIIVQMIEETVTETCQLRATPGPVGTFDVHTNGL